MDKCLAEREEDMARKEAFQIECDRHVDWDLVNHDVQRHRNKQAVEFVRYVQEFGVDAPTTKGRLTAQDLKFFQREHDRYDEESFA